MRKNFVKPEGKTHRRMKVLAYKYAQRKWPTYNVRYEYSHKLPETKGVRFDVVAISKNGLVKRLAESWSSDELVVYAFHKLYAFECHTFRAAAKVKAKTLLSRNIVPKKTFCLGNAVQEVYFVFPEKGKVVIETMDQILKN